jgi:hypothetical protein
MPRVVRVIGRIDVAEDVCRTLRGAGVDAQVATAGPMSIYGGTPPAEGLDFVLATSIFDPPLWRLAKRKRPLRPMVAIADGRRERVLRGALRRRNGPDAYVTWPAPAAELLTAVARAEAAAGRRRTWSRVDFAAALSWCGVVVFNGRVILGRHDVLAASTGVSLIGIGLLLNLPFAWSMRWQALGGVLLTGLGFVGLVTTALLWLQ